MSDRPLTPRQQRFVDEYLIDLNATQAAIRAGYSERTAQEQSSRLLSNAMVQQAIQQAQQARSEITGVRAANVLREIALLAHSTITDYVIDDHGNVTLAEGVHPGAIRAVASIKKKIRAIGETVVERETEIKLWSKTESLKLASQHLGLLKERLELTGKDGGPVALTVEQATTADRDLEEFRRVRASLNGATSGT